jgi:nitric oxide reductase NorD protein
VIFRRYLRNRAIGLTRRVTAPMRHWRGRRAPARLELVQVRRRLELLLSGMYGRTVRVGAKRRPTGGAAQPELDVVLPRSLDASHGIDAAAARYRLLAIEQAERLARGTGVVPLPANRLERDLFTLAEGAAVERAILDRAPGLASTIAELHARELASRPPLRGLTTEEREVELLARALVGDLSGASSAQLPSPGTPSDSLAWASVEAARIRGAPAASGRYRGLPGFESWQLATLPRREELPPIPGSSLSSIGMPSSAAAAPARRDVNDEPDAEPEASMTSLDAVKDETADGGASSTSDDAAADARDEAGGRKRGTPDSRGRETRASEPGISYPEWDHYAGRYRPDATTVHEALATEGDEQWADDTLREHATIVRQVRARFSQLRARRDRLRAQRSGDELDLDACVSALVDMRMHRVPTDRLYLLTRPARRTLAIVLLVDVSGSTGTKIADDRTVLDVERMTVLLASEALDALGDPYAVLAFSGAGAHDVELLTVKRFSGDARDAVHRRIAGLASMDYTRLGAALRHASAILNAQPAERRLLLLLSDGKPNDLRGYQGVYAVEDSRRALAEARASGVHSFCLTVDREETEYLPHLFGVSGYRLIRAPEQLPEALLRVVEQLLPN